MPRLFLLWTILGMAIWTMPTRAATFVCVDCYSSALRFLDILDELAPGSTKVHLKIRHHLKDRLRGPYLAQRHRFDYEFEGLTERTLAQLRTLDPVLVFAGTDTGVAAADLVAQALGLAGNNPATSKNRYRKLPMAQALLDESLNAIPTLAVRSAAEIRAWLQHHPSEKIVIKPDASSGTDRVSILDTHDPDFLRIADESIAEILSTTDAWGQAVPYAIAQAYIEGDEYYLDFVHGYNLGIWRYIKVPVPHPDSHRTVDIYWINELLPAEGEVQTKLLTYAAAANRAQGVAHGLAHMEIKIRADDGQPVQIENNQRPAGLNSGDFVRQVTGESPLELLIRKALDPQDFARRTVAPYTMRENIFLVHLPSEGHGTLRADAEANLRALLPAADILDVQFHIPGGTLVGPTKDMATSLGYVFIKNPSREVLLEHARTILSALRNGKVVDYTSLQPCERLSQIAHGF